LRGEGGDAKQEKREHEKKGGRWEGGKERWRRGGNMYEGRGGKGGRVMKRNPA